ncbi:uncharacterized protein LOC144684304 isoform X2 [Cetorhinus maximus]
MNMQKKIPSLSPKEVNETGKRENSSTTVKIVPKNRTRNKEVDEGMQWMFSTFSKFAHDIKRGSVANSKGRSTSNDGLSSTP